MKILVIEDNAEIMSILEYLLEEEGYEVVSCTDGSSVNNLHNINPDLILLDELLPGVKGSSLCKEIKAKETTRHIPIVIISAVPGLSEIANDCGADGHIEKPFNIDNLTTVIKGLIR
ncbi:response regulator transcription factor [Mucilaginibacter ginkgonis]|uniref:Response regulator n=1 Tax=Mucilaginibacter ginkgonis TaxID=2682091 RepID=A0A6I4IMH0_9SPHI|nr:response regulator [Mucilaginibacter ginkgonis]QQL50349.1 response regulator [Mucilaginibacter ginkgonis]